MFFDLNDNSILDMENLGPCTAGSDCQLVKWEVVSSNLYHANAQIRHITKEKVLPWPLEMRLC